MTGEVDKMDFFGKVERKEARVAVVGAGYVGLPLAVEICRAGMHVVALDKKPERVQSLLEGISYIKDVSSSELQDFLKKGLFDATTETGVLSEVDAVIICVPTPLRKTKDPDVSFIMDAAGEVAAHLGKEQLVVLESTTYPGFTREMLQPHLEGSDRKAGKDFFLGFSPERVDPGNQSFGTRNTPKVIGGVTEECLMRVKALYSAFIDRLVPVSSTDAAEMVKLLENTFRAVNIGMVNEVAIMCHKLGLDTWEVIEAAATKPFGFMPFYPGPGLGGHCIPVDPHYLSWKLKTLEYNARFIELAGEVNSHMPLVVVERVVDVLNGRKKAVNGSRILVLGVAYKKNIDDVRESPALDIINALSGKGADVFFHDPFVESLKTLHGGEMRSVAPDDLSSYDCAVIVTDHDEVDYKRVLNEVPAVVDTRNATASYRAGASAEVVTI